MSMPRRETDFAGDLQNDSTPVDHLSARAEQKSWSLDVGDPSPAPANPQAAAETAPPPLTRILEAMLFVGGSPLTAERAAAAIRGLAPEQFLQVMDSLNRTYRLQGRPYMIQCRDRGYILVLRPPFRAVADNLYGQIREARLSTVAIDVLSLVAYRQPVPKQEIDSLRGAESGALLRQLIRRGLVAVVRRGEAGQREVYYGTTARFLELFKLNSLDDLPQTQDLQKL